VAVQVGILSFFVIILF